MSRQRGDKKKKKGAREVLLKSTWDRGSWEGNQSDGEAEVQELRYPKQTPTAEHSMFPPCCCLRSEGTLQSHQQGGTGSTELEMR